VAGAFPNNESFDPALNPPERLMAGLSKYILVLIVESALYSCMIMFQAFSGSLQKACEMFQHMSIPHFLIRTPLPPCDALRSVFWRALGLGGGPAVELAHASGAPGGVVHRQTCSNIGSTNYSTACIPTRSRHSGLHLTFQCCKRLVSELGFML